MSSDPLRSSLSTLTDVQRRAVDWDGGRLLMLAGPGSGKTRVLACRIARLLDGTRKRHFRILVLTCTNKAAMEIKTRVAEMVPGLEERANATTFPGFCEQVLGQHGAHLHIKSDFSVYSLPVDRQAVLEDALRRAGGNNGTSREDVRYLPLIDSLKERLIAPDRAEAFLSGANGAASIDAGHIACVYRLYEEELRRAGALDFNSLVFETYRLFKTYPVFPEFYQQSCPYWLIDEFQDTNDAQYRLLLSMVIGGFRDVFVVSDDDGIGSEWNGASMRRTRDFVRKVDCEVMQLPTNFRCPPDVVEAASRLTVYHGRRADSNRPAAPTATVGHAANPDEAPVRCLVFSTDAQEIAGIAGEIASLDAEERNGTAVLARRRAPLQAVRDALQERDVPAYLDLRRGDFASAEVRWLAACLEQVRRPLDRRNMALLGRSFEQFSEARVDWEEIASRSESEGVTWLAAWLDSVRGNGAEGTDDALVAPVAALAAGAITPAAAADQVLTCLERRGADDDLKEDLEAWRRLHGDAGSGNGDLSPAGFLPASPPAPGAVTLTTMHGARGREFDTVYLLGLAEGILPSCRSIRTEAEDGGAAMDEERRECYVVITGARRRVVLSRARRYRGTETQPSRFLAEMGAPPT